MPSGFQCWNNSGVIQIDATAPVLSYRQKGSATLGTIHPVSASSGQSTVARYTDITITATDVPTIALYGPSAYGVIACKRVGNSWTFRVIGLSNQTIGNPPFTWFHFDSPLSRASGAGKEVFDATGRCLYSTYHQPINVKNFQGSGLSQEAFSADLPSNRSYASIFSAAITLQEWSEHYTNQNVYYFWEYYVHVASAEVNPNPYNTSVKRVGFNAVSINNGSSGGQSAGYYPGGDLGGWGAATSALFVDVTDIL